MVPTSAASLPGILAMAAGIKRWTRSTRAFPLPLHDGIVGVVAGALPPPSRHVAAGGGPTLPGLRAVPLLDLGLGRVLVAAAGPAGRAAGGGNLDRRGHAQRSCW